MTSKTNKAPAAPAGVLEEFGRLREILATTHTEIPQLLARERTLGRALGLNETAELKAQLEDVTQQRQAAVRRRAAAIGAIGEMEPALQAERASVEAARQAYAGEAVAAFQERYQAAVRALQSCWEEGRTLSAALRCAVPMPLPVMVAVSPVDGVARAQPILAGMAPTVDAEGGRLGARIDQVDGALALVGAIKQAGELEARHHVMARGAAGAHNGAYKVLLTFRCQADGLEFQPGELIDRSLIGAGMLHRLMMGRRYVQPLELEVAA